MSLQELQKTTEAVHKELSSGGADTEVLRKQLQDLRGLLTPENVTDEGTRKRLSVLHAQVTNRASFLNGLQQRTNVQDETLSALNQLSSSLAGHGILERRFDNDTLHTVTTHNWSPYNWFRRAGLGETGAALAGGATALGALYIAKRILFGAGRGAYRGVRRGVEYVGGWLRSLATFGAGVAAGAAGLIGLQRLNPSWLPEFLRSTPATPLTPEQIKKQEEEKKKLEEQEKKTGEELQKTIEALPAGDLLASNPPLERTINGVNVTIGNGNININGRRMTLTVQPNAGTWLTQPGQPVFATVPIAMNLTFRTLQRNPSGNLALTVDNPDPLTNGTDPQITSELPRNQLAAVITRLATAGGTSDITLDRGTPSRRYILRAATT